MSAEGADSSKASKKQQKKEDKKQKKGSEVEVDYRTLPAESIKLFLSNDEELNLKVALVAAHLNAAVVPIRSSGPAFPVKPAVIQHTTQVFGANNVARFLQNVELTTAANDLINFEEFTVSPALREGTSIVFLPPASHTYAWPSPRIHERE